MSFIGRWSPATIRDHERPEPPVRRARQNVSHCGPDCQRSGKVDLQDLFLSLGMLAVGGLVAGEYAGIPVSFAKAGLQRVS